MSKHSAGSMHCTNIAFDRYYQTDPEELRKVYQDIRFGPRSCAADGKGSDYSIQ